MREMRDYRNCDVLGEHDESYENEWVSGRTSRYILRCRGCDFIFFQTIDVDYQEVASWKQSGGDPSEEPATIKYWPAISQRKKPDWVNGLDLEPRLDQTLTELYGALDSDLNMLAAIAIRTTFDVAAELLQIDEMLHFDQKLAALVEQ